MTPAAINSNIIVTLNCLVLVIATRLDKEKEVVSLFFADLLSLSVYTSLLHNILLYGRIAIITMKIVFMLLLILAISVGSRSNHCISASFGV